MSDEIFKLYQSISKYNIQTLNKPNISVASLNMPLGQNQASQSNEQPRTKPHLNYMNININDYLNNKKVSSNFSSVQNPNRSNYESDQLNQEMLLRRKREKCNKGLRHFSMKVCEKVKEKGLTTYNQVADELVNEYCNYSSSSTNNQNISNDFFTYDQKNVRRRVYDALNVLMAMNIISKEKKEIKWIGLPCNKKQECQDLEAEKRKKKERIQQKSEILKNLLLEQVAVKSLIERNKEKKISNEQNQVEISLPLLILNTDPRTSIDCNVSNDRKEYSIQFDNVFQINSDLDLLKKLGFTDDLDSSCQYSDEKDVKIKKLSSMVPVMFEPYIKQLAENKKIEPICFHSNIPNYNKIVKSDLLEITKSTKQVKKSLRTINQEDETENLEDPKGDSNDLEKVDNEDTDTMCAINSDDDNSFDNYEDEDEDDEDEEEEEEADEEEDIEDDSLIDALSQ